MLHGIKVWSQHSELIPIMDGRLKHPYTCIVAGPTMSGKTEWTKQLLVRRHACIDQPPDDIIWCYGQWQPGYDTLKSSVRFVEGLVDAEDLDPSRRHLVIIDDLMDSGDQRIEQFFTKICHHRNTSCIYIVQNLFNQGKGHRTCSINCQYMVIFKNPRECQQIAHLARQMYPGEWRSMVEAYRDATEAPHSYLFIDMKPATPDPLRLRSHVLDPRQVVYVPKKYKKELRSAPYHMSSWHASSRHLVSPSSSPDLH